MPVGDAPAKLTADAKAAIQLVFEDLGGTTRLMEWANQPGNLGQFYTQIWSKIIPKDVKAEITGKNGKDLTLEIIHSMNLRALSDGELETLTVLTSKAAVAIEHTSD